MPRQVGYTRDLSGNARKRHAHETDQGKVLGFTVQLEVWHDAKWNPIVRYDGSHGFPHKDVFRRNGESRKEPLKMSFAGELAVTKFERLNSVLGYEFDRYVMEHPDFAEKIPPGAIVVLQLEGEDAFNKWARSISERNRSKDKDENGPILYVRIKGLRPPKSRLIRPVIAKSA